MVLANRVRKRKWDIAFVEGISPPVHRGGRAAGEKKWEGPWGPQTRRRGRQEDEQGGSPGGRVHSRGGSLEVGFFLEGALIGGAKYVHSSRGRFFQASRQGDGRG